jgi:hypothetical protein
VDCYSLPPPKKKLFSIKSNVLTDMVPPVSPGSFLNSFRRHRSALNKLLLLRRTQHTVYSGIQSAPVLQFQRAKKSDAD